MSVPALRFKDDIGQDFPEWRDKSIGSVLSIGSGRDYKHLSNGDIPVYGTGGYMLSVNKYLYDGESVCIGRKGTIDRPTLLNGKFWTVDTLFYTHSFKNCLPKFIYATFQRIDWKNHNEASGVPSLSKSTIEKIEISLPSIDEQTKIANFLTAVDEKITQLIQKHDLLTQYKKGVMQQIFSQELRFKDNDGRDFPEWEEYLLKDALIKNSSKNKNSEFNLVQSVSNKHGFINQDELFEDRVIASKDLSNYYVIKRGAFAYNPSRIDVGSLAYKSDDLISVVSPLYISFYSKPNLIVDSYLFNWFDTQQFKNQMNNSFEGSVRNTLSYDSLSKICIILPCVSEQTKIANFLSAIDDKISTTQAQLDAVKQYKQGLLQQMFV